MKFIAISFARLTFLTIIMLTSHAAMCQTASIFELYDERKGLSNNWTSDIALDSSGFLWIGTRNGLNRFDGHQFKIFRHDPHDSSSLLHDYGQNLYVDKKGDLWLAYYEGGISRFIKNSQSFIHYPETNKRINGNVDKSFKILLVDDSGRIFYSGNGIGLNILNATTSENVQINLPINSTGNSPIDNIEFNTVTYIYPFSKSEFWLTTYNGIYSYNLKNNKINLVYRSEIHKSFNLIVPQGDSGLWFSSAESAISYYNLKNREVSTYLIDSINPGHYNLSFDIIRKSENEFWVAAGDRGLLVFNMRSGKYTYDANINLGSRSVFTNDICITRHGEIVLRDEIGVYKYSPYTNLFNFKHLPLASSQHGELFLIHKIVENEDRNEIYFATDLGNGLNILNLNNNNLLALSIDVNQEIDNKIRVRDIEQDKNGNYWVLARDYLYAFNPERKLLTRLKNLYNDKYTDEHYAFKYFVKDPHGKLYVFTEKGVLFNFNTASHKLEEVEWLNKKYLTRFENISDIIFSSDGAVFVNNSNQLAIGIPGNKFVMADLDSIYKDKTGRIVSVCTDRHGAFWLAINNIGIVKMERDGNKITNMQVIGTNEGLSTPRISRMAIDQRDNLWLSTYMGILVYSIEQKNFWLFKQNVGIDRYNMLVRYSIASDSSFYLTAPGNYCKVDYKNLFRKGYSPVMYLDKLITADASLSLSHLSDNKIKIKPGNDYFTIEYGCLDFSNQDYHQFAYRLIGSDKDWHYINIQRFARITNISPGKYTFQVKVANVEGLWSEPISVNIEVQALFYQTAWFRVIVVLFLALLIFSIYLIRINQIRNTERVKADFNRQVTESKMAALRAQMNPHFIFNSLNSINRYIIKNDLKTSSLYLTRFARLIRIILDSSASSSIPLDRELEALKLYIELEQLRFDNKFEYQIVLDDSVHAEFIKVPPLIFQPYVENAIWHGLLPKNDDCRLNIRMSLTDDMLIAEIVDNGIGRGASAARKSEQNATRKSVGIKLTEERLRNLGNVNSQHGSQEIIDLYHTDGTAAGTKVILKIPVE